MFSVHACTWLTACFIVLLEWIEYYNGLKWACWRTGSEWHIEASFELGLWFNGWNISTLDKYSELYWVSVRSLVYTAQKTVWKICSLHNTLLYKILYTASLLQILHLLIPSNTWYLRWNTQFITYKRRHTISCLHLNSYNCPHTLPATTDITNLEHWLLLKGFIFWKHMT